MEINLCDLWIIWPKVNPYGGLNNVIRSQSCEIIAKIQNTSHEF